MIKYIYIYRKTVHIRSSTPYLEESLKLVFHQGILMFYLLQAFQTPTYQSLRFFTKKEKKSIHTTRTHVPCKYFGW